MQVNNYFFLGGKPGARRAAGAADRLLADGAGGVPAPPDWWAGDAEVRALAAAWLAVPPEPVAVLGAPGIGKSAVCLAALHDARVREAFGPRRSFVRCDGAGSADAVLAGIAAVAGVAAEDAAVRLTDQVRVVLGNGRGVLVLDNFETPWTADPLAVEVLLRTIAAIPELGLAVTARGTAWPRGLRWRDFPMMSPLEPPQARQLFLEVAGAGFAAVPALDGLVAAVDGVPLAVELLGYAAQGEPDLAGWHSGGSRSGPRACSADGGGRRELSMAASVEASLGSPLMTVPARRLFGLLGLLPDGAARDDLPVLLPGHGLAAATALRQLDWFRRRAPGADAGPGPRARRRRAPARAR